MKTFIVTVIGVAVLFCGLKAALLWRDWTLAFRPVPSPKIPTCARAWSDVAGYEQSNKVNELNRKAAKWTAATALIGFVGLVAGLWPT